MSRRRFHASPDDIAGGHISLSDDESHHLIRTLRLKPGDEVFAFDGSGKEYRCRLVALNGGRARLEIIESLADIVESPVSLTLVQALAKGEKLDFIVQKATELGVSRIIPLVTEYSEVRIRPEQIAGRLERWRRISLEALKQCGRRRLVEIDPPMSVNRLVEGEGPDKLGCLLVFSEKGGAAISEAVRDIQAPVVISALVGPEGGWTDNELDVIGKSGAKAITLGPRILRTETAAIVAITLIQHALGDLST